MTVQREGSSSAHDAPTLLCSVAFLQIFTVALLGSLIVPSGNIRAQRGLEVVVVILSSRRWLCRAS